MLYNWIIMVAGASILFAVFDIVLPIGKMNSFVKNILNIFYMYILIFPVIEFIKGVL